MSGRQSYLKALQCGFIYQTYETVRIYFFWVTLRMGPVGCPATSVRNYHYSLRNSPEERSS